MDYSRHSDHQATSPQLKPTVLPTAVEQSVIKTVTYILVTVLALAVAAQVKIHLPFTPVPISAQTMTVALCAWLAPGRAGLWGTLIYFLGVTWDAPWFAQSTAVIGGPTWGYLVGMCLSAFWLNQIRSRIHTGIGIAAALAFSSMLVLGSGAVWLNWLGFTSDQVWAMGVLPFLPGDLVKNAIAGGIIFSLRR